MHFERHLAFQNALKKIPENLKKILDFTSKFR